MLYNRSEQTRLPALCRHPVAVTILWLGLVGAAPADTSLTPHSARYDVEISVLNGRLETRLMATPVGYEAVHRIVPTGMARLIAGGQIEEISRFSATDDGVLPKHYRSNDSLTSDKTKAAVDFNWSDHRLTGIVNGAEVEYELDQLVHDRVSIQYELMQDLKNGNASASYSLFDIDEFKQLEVTNVGEREVTVPAGRYNAIGIRHRSKGSSRTTTLWCVPELDYLPVIIEQHRKGKLRLRAELTDYEPAEPR